MKQKAKKRGIKRMELTCFILLLITAASISGWVFTAQTLQNKLDTHMEQTDKLLEENNKELLKLRIENLTLAERVETKSEWLENAEKKLRTSEAKLAEAEKKIAEYEAVLNDKSYKERLPEGPTNMFCYMDYRKLQNQTTNQYWLQQECSTNTLGIRTYKGYFCVAMGSAYGQDIGDTWRVTLKNGRFFNVILADCKGDDAGNMFGHECKNYDGEDCINLIEFVVDEEKMDEGVKKAGTFGALDIFGGLHGSGGNIESIEYTGRIWTRE